MLNNVTIKKLLLIIGAFVTILTALNVYTSYTQIKKVEEHYNKKEYEIYPQIINFSRLEKDVIQVQQWLTDISATRAYQGFDDGFNEAKKYYDDAQSVLENIIREHKKNNETKIINEIEVFKSNFESFYQIGQKMANAYIKGGPEEGNKMMEELDLLLKN